MVRGIATKPARIGSDKIYLTKARDFLKGTIMEAEKENWNSAAVLSIHAVISACDAICAKFLQLRHGGVDHMQAIELLGSLPFERSEIESKLKQARRIISLKNAAEWYLTRCWLRYNTCGLQVSGTALSPSSCQK